MQIFGSRTFLLYFKTEDSTEDSSKQYIFDLIKAERARQEEKHGEGNRGSSNFRYLTITTEELGEVAKALLDGESTERIIEELVQVAAVCVQWIEKLKG
jgi:NTP pyrophosphatase (non-canonical NTP hydrolase)